MDLYKEHNWVWWFGELMVKEAFYAALLMDNNQPGIDIGLTYKTGNKNTLSNWTHYFMSQSPLNRSTLIAIKMYINGNLITDINRTFNIDTQLKT